jgi:hypothetical protein
VVQRAQKNGPAWSWFTGWFNFLGQVTLTTEQTDDLLGVNERQEGQ